MRQSASSWTALATAVTLALAAGAAGTLTAVETATVTLATVVPVTLASNEGTILPPYTSASLTGIGLPLGGIMSVTVLTVQHGANPWNVQMVATAKSGFGLTDSVVLTLVGPTSSGITLTLGSSVPASTGTIALGTTSDISVTARGVCVGTCSITLELRFAPAGAAVPSFVLPVTLGVT